MQERNIRKQNKTLVKAYVLIPSKILPVSEISIITNSSDWEIEKDVGNSHNEYHAELAVTSLCLEQIIVSRKVVIADLTF